jgi:hypothetical protein
MTSNEVGTASHSPVAGSPTAVFATVDHDNDERATSPGASVRAGDAASVRTCRDRTGEPSLRAREIPPNPRRWQAERPVFVSVSSAAPRPAGAVAGVSAATSCVEVQTPTVVGVPGAGLLGGGVLGLGFVGLGVPGTGVVGLLVVGVDVAACVGADVAAVVAAGVGAPTVTPPWNEHPVSTTPVRARTATTSGRDTGGRTRPV